MTSASELSSEPRRSRVWLYLPFALLFVLACAWSAAWYWAAGKAGETIDVWLQREADRGRVYACGGRSIGGYPFRIEVDCADPTARVAVEGGEAHVRAPRFVALAQVWDPKRVIGELTGPVAFTLPDGRKGELSFASAQGSASAEGRRLQRGSLVLGSPRLELDGEEIASAAAFEGHLRRSPETAGAYDVAATVEGGLSPFVAAFPVGQGPVQIELQAQATELDSQRPGPLAERLRTFAQAGGRVNVTLAKITRGDVAAQAKGDLALDLDGRLNGSVDIAARGVDELINSMVGGGGEDTVSALLGMGAKMLGKKTELDGKPATRYRLKLDRGRVALGPVKLTRVPPAF